MIKISVVIITFNEETNIERCLLSVKDIADEIVVLDSFSTDKTEDICKKYSVTFLQHEFDGHIEQKNRVITHTKNNFVLSLDADEVLSKELINSIIEVKNNPKYDAYFFNRQNFFCENKIKHGGWYPDKKIRLWNKYKGKWGGINPHDTVILNDNTTKKYIKGDLLHYSFTSVNQHIAQINKFSNIKAEQDLLKDRKSSILKIIFNPFIKFVILYFLKLGFLDGYYGFIIAINSSHFTFLRYVKLKELNKTNKK